MIDATPNTNYFLNYLSKSQRKMIIDRCTQIELLIGDVLYTVGMPIKHVYFPITAFVSLMTDIVDNKSIQVGLIGNEGMLGATFALENKNAPMTSVVRNGGSALTMDADSFNDLITQYPQTNTLILNYLYVLMQQFAQTGACNRHHSVKQRLARWLLATQDRTRGKQLHLTHDLISKILGVRRSAVTIAAGKMMRQGTIGYNRGKIVVFSRQMLEETSCGCYQHAINIYNKSIQPLTIERENLQPMGK